jgi:hypothetical protein
MELRSLRSPSGNRIVGFWAAARNAGDRAGIVSYDVNLHGLSEPSVSSIVSSLPPALRRFVVSEDRMSKSLILALVFAGLPVAAYAQDNPTRAGAEAGGAVGGAVGAIVTAPLAAAAGPVGGLTGAEAPRFHHYVIEQNVPSYAWAGHPQVVVGDVLPPAGVTLYTVPPQFGVTAYNYTVVDNTPVLVDPRTRKVVEVVP